MVVMITPVAFNSIGYKTYIIFAVINFAILPVTYFFYPETAYRSLEEIDTIFEKTNSWFSAVSVAKHQPLRYGKNGELLIDYENTDEHIRRVESAPDGRPIKEMVGATKEVRSGDDIVVHKVNTIADGESGESAVDPEKALGGAAR